MRLARAYQIVKPRPYSGNPAKRMHSISSSARLGSTNMGSLCVWNCQPDTRLHPIPTRVSNPWPSYLVRSSWEWAKRPTRPKAQVLPPGSYFAFPPGTAHFASTDVETIVQISTVGPYVNPKDDPRQTQ